jgi:hypothetical protein
MAFWNQSLFGFSVGRTFEFTNLNPLQYVSPDANVNSDGVTELAAMMAMSTFYGDAGLSSA